MNRLEVNNDNSLSDLRNKTKEIVVFNKVSNMHSKELEEQMPEQSKKLWKMEKLTKVLQTM